MNIEQTYFLRILSDHLNGRKTTERADADWPVLLEYAQNHQVSGIVYHQCRAFLPEDTGKRLEQKHSAELYYYYNRAALFAQLTQALTGAGVPFYTVKGLDVAQYYPIPALRTMGDCDIVVHPEDKEKAHAVMTALGFSNDQKADSEWTYFKNGLEFEIHDHLLYDDFGSDKRSRERADLAWEHAEPTGEGTRYALDWSFHFLFLLLHLKKHLIYYGAGFRQFMDLDVVLRRCELDWDWLDQPLRDLNMWRFTRICLALLKRWFDTPLPFDVEPLDEDFFAEATDKIFVNGIFGFNDAANEENRRLNAIARRSGPRALVRVRNLIAGVFPSYRAMRYVEHYAFVNGRPWLLPAAWVYRFYRSLRYRMGDNGKRMIGSAFIPDEQLDEREKTLAKWGF